MAAALRLIFAAAAFFATHALAQPAAAEIERLLGLGRATDAYEFALRRAEKEAGDLRFDLAFARAALAANHPEQAVFALERVLVLDPTHHQARLDLARTEALLGNHTAARQTLAVLFARNPPESVRREAVALLLSLRDDVGYRSAARARVYAEAKYGYDTNVNSASSLTSVDVYTPAQVTQVTGEPAKRDQFTQFDLVVEGDKPLSAGALLFGSLSGSARDNAEFDAFDTRSGEIRTGGLLAGSSQHLRLTAQWQQLYLDGAHYRRLKLFIPEWGWRPTHANQLFAFGQVGTLRYPTQPVRDVDLQLIGLAWVHRFSTQTQAMLSAYRGVEESGEDDATTWRKHFGRDYTGWRTRLQSMVAVEHHLFVGGGTQQSEHAAPDPTFLTQREDNLRIAEAGWQWKLAPTWIFKAEVNHYRNSSNIELYEYRRTQTLVGMRYNF